MYVSGFITGSLAMFLAAAGWTLVLLARFDDLLWRERAQKIAAERPRKVIIEDWQGNRRIAYEADTISLTDYEP